MVRLYVVIGIAQWSDASSNSFRSNYCKLSWVWPQTEDRLALLLLSSDLLTRVAMLLFRRATQSGRLRLRGVSTNSLLVVSTRRSELIYSSGLMTESALSRGAESFARLCLRTVSTNFSSFSTRPSKLYSSGQVALPCRRT